LFAAAVDDAVPLLALEVAVAAPPSVELALDRAVPALEAPAVASEVPPP
jgi:hypothetical protein